MPEQPDQVGGTLSPRQERKQLLVLACSLDRAGWRMACRPSRGRGSQIASNVLSHLETIGSFLPGRIGRWLRGFSFLAQIGRRLGWLGL